jgi:hypothetical protein
LKGETQVLLYQINIKALFLGMTDQEVRFYDSMKSSTCPPKFPVLLQALWHDGRGDWHAAHNLINDLPGTDMAWVHAYLHRKEGDLSNADYWYKEAGKKRPASSLQEEWHALVAYFVNR